MGILWSTGIVKHVCKPPALLCISLLCLGKTILLTQYRNVPAGSAGVATWMPASILNMGIVGGRNLIYAAIVISG
ncbi:hypothetical protein [Chitinophaga tropicalis]|uniref:Uncharacterized protein n=1 Tax=Chitinophaga tropicalis TaxID=2683588 RepID=A0A7K1UAQ5_9BACT|nr:hypothetical protein [Chitinophaga tropicalis]MVT11358.1 hypothetical protein [Chitinophaga tropicalis]